MKLRYYILMILFAMTLIVGCNSISQVQSNQPTCEDVLNATLKNSCYEDYALAQKNITYCEKIKTEDPFQSGKMGCYMKMAAATGNYSLCFVYSRYNSSAICLRDVAVSTNDSAVCELDNIEPDVCYLAFAVKNSRAAVCDSISSTDVRDKCVDEIQNGVKYYCITYESC